MMYMSVTDLHPSELLSREFLGSLSLCRADVVAVLAAMVTMLIVSLKQEHSEVTLRERICKRSFVFQSLIFILLFYAVVIFGVYGPGSNPADFYYMQF